MTNNQRSNAIPVDEEGYLLDPSDWTEGFASVAASHDGLTPDRDPLGADPLFRDVSRSTSSIRTCTPWCRPWAPIRASTLSDQKSYRDFLYGLFPERPGPVVELCKLAGLPKPLEDVVLTRPEGRSHRPGVKGLRPALSLTGPGRQGDAGTIERTDH